MIKNQHVTRVIWRLALCFLVNDYRTGLIFQYNRLISKDLHRVQL